MQRAQTSFTACIERILLITTIAGFTFAIYNLLGLYSFIVLIFTCSLLSLLVYIKCRQFRQKGLITYFGQKIRSILLQRSLLDIFRDIVYFPYVIKIITAILTIVTSRPHPDSISQILKSLPPQVQQVLTRKGILSLAPQAVESLLLPEINKQLPVQYGRNDSQWDRKDQYQQSGELVHQQTYQKRIQGYLDEKLGWATILVLFVGVLTGFQQMKRRNFKKMIVKNGTFCCLVLSLIALVVKLRRHYQVKKKKIVSSVKAAQKIIHE